jgi:hypothetical protein
MIVPLLQSALLVKRYLFKYPQDKIIIKPSEYRVSTSVDADGWYELTAFLMLRKNKETGIASTGSPD